MRPVLVYTASRIGLFVIALVVLYLLGVAKPFLGIPGPFWLITAAFLVSGVASFVLLSKQRDAMSARISEKTNQPRSEEID